MYVASGSHGANHARYTYLTCLVACFKWHTLGHIGALQELGYSEKVRVCGPVVVDLGPVLGQSGVCGDGPARAASMVSALDPFRPGARRACQLLTDLTSSR